MPASTLQSPLVRLPRELHSSAHQVRFESSLIGEYEIRIYRGALGPVIVFEEGSSSPLPLEYLTEHAVDRFLGSCPNAQARFFERHRLPEEDLWVEISREGGGFVRNRCTPLQLGQAFSSADDRVQRSR